MAIGFPTSAGDSSFGSLTSTVTIAPPANTADGDLLIAVASSRDNTLTSTPSGWTTEQAAYTTSGSIGAAVIQYLAVPTAASLPANWSWGFSESRVCVLIFRVTGVNLSSIWGGKATGFNPSGNASLPASSVSSGGAGFSVAFTFFAEFDLAVPSSPFGTSSWPVLWNQGMTGSNREALVVAGGADNGSGATASFTVDLSAQWPVGGSSTQAAIAVLGLEAASGGSVNDAEAALTVTPGLAAAAARTAFAQAALTVTPALAAAVTRTATAQAALAVTPGLAAGTAHTATAQAALTVTPVLSAGAAGPPSGGGGDDYHHRRWYLRRLP